MKKTRSFSIKEALKGGKLSGLGWGTKEPWSSASVIIKNLLPCVDTVSPSKQ